MCIDLSLVKKDPDIIPVVLFAYARPVHLRRVLAVLRTERVPLIYAFADGAKGADEMESVAEVRRILRGIAWTDVRLVEREQNLGLGANVMAGVRDVAGRHDAFVVWEDDLIGVPGTYAWMCAALRRYADVPRVMSVTAWTHPRVTPAEAVGQPYFDGRAECWVWGAYARSWPGMERTATEKIETLRGRGVSADVYGGDLPHLARAEQRRGTWAVRWLYHHIEHGGLCLRPPWSMVEHIGIDDAATNAAGADRWANPSPRPAPAIPDVWPEAVEHSQCRELWQTAAPNEAVTARVAVKAAAGARKLVRSGRGIWRRVVPQRVRTWLGRVWARKQFRGDYANWAEACAASGGYADGAILDRVLKATLVVARGEAAFERDGVLFYEPEADAPLTEAMTEISRATGGSLRVVDFGGSLGSSYWRLRNHWPGGGELAWDVVEQAGFVAAGKKYLAREPLQFFATVAEAEAARRHDVLLCSGVLQYLAEPARMLAEWRELSIPFLLINNLPLHAAGPDRLRVQHVPPSIYPASYPVWFFNRAAFLARLEADYDVVREFASEAVWPVGLGMYPSTGLLLKRKAPGAKTGSGESGATR